MNTYGQINAGLVDTRPHDTIDTGIQLGPTAEQHLPDARISDIIAEQRPLPEASNDVIAEQRPRPEASNHVIAEQRPSQRHFAR